MVSSALKRRCVDRGIVKPRLATPGFRLGNIELIRGIAALMVVAAHFAGALEARGAELGSSSTLLAFGVAGVDLFFVISGFVIVWSQLSRSRGTWAFMKNRIRRIVPLYWVLTFLALGVILLSQRVSVPVEGQTPGVRILVSSLFFVSQPLGYSYPLLYQGWTLEYEMLFYALFACTLFLRRIWLAIGFASLAIVTIVLFTSVSDRLIEFILGMAVALATNFLPAPRRWLVRAIFVVGVLMFLGTSQVDLSGLPVWIVWGVPSALIIYGAANLRQAHSAVGSELGSASYAVYLIQWFTVPAIMLIVGAVASHSRWVLLLWGIAALLVTQVAGIAFTRYVDKPMTGVLRARGF